MVSKDICPDCGGELEFYDGGPASDYEAELLVCEDCFAVYELCPDCDGGGIRDGEICESCAGEGILEA